MTLRRWEPISPFVAMRQLMDRMMEEPFRPVRLLPSVFVEGWVPLDIYQTADHVVIKADLPGLRPEDVELTITGNTLTLKGETKPERETKEEDYFLCERRFGAFSRTVTLPEHVDADKAEASFENGVLTVKVPKHERARAKTIKVESR